MWEPVGREPAVEMAPNPGCGCGGGGGAAGAALQPRPAGPARWLGERPRCMPADVKRSWTGAEADPDHADDCGKGAAGFSGAGSLVMRSARPW